MNEQTGTPGTNRMTYREACRQAIRHALIDDPRTFLMGEDVGLYGGCYAVSKGLLQEFGPGRIKDTPLAEAAFVGGRHRRGEWWASRPIVEIMTCNFSLLALDQIMNNAATIPHMSGGQIAVPVVHPHGDGRGKAARRPALAQPRRLVRPHSGPQGAGPGHDRGRPLHAEGRIGRPQPGADLRAHRSLQCRRRAGPGGRSSRHREGEGAPAGMRM